MIDLIQSTIREGGIVLWALLLLAVTIYALVADLWICCARLRERLRAREWQLTPDTHGASQALDSRQLQSQFALFALQDCARIDRRLPFLGILIGAAPLLGLLGTVVGMLITFGGIADAPGVAPIDTVSIGISRALVTTQAGLIVAVPAAFLIAFLKRKADLLHGELERQLHEKTADAGTLT